MHTYLDRFKAIASQINQHPWLEVVDFSEYPPATNDVFSMVEDRIGAPLAESLRAFYGETNGLRLYWRFRRDLDEAEFARIEEECDEFEIGVPSEEDEEYPFAKIELVPLEDAVINLDWTGKIVFPELESSEDTVEFAGSTYKEPDFDRRIRPFDLYSRYSCAAFFLEVGQGNPIVLLLGDHYIEWDGSRITDFASYLELLLATRGIVEARSQVLDDYRGDLKPRLSIGTKDWPEIQIPSLFR